MNLLASTELYLVSGFSVIALAVRLLAMARGGYGSRGGQFQQGCDRGRGAGGEVTPCSVPFGSNTTSLTWWQCGQGTATLATTRPAPAKFGPAHCRVTPTGESQATQAKSRLTISSVMGGPFGRREAGWVTCLPSSPRTWSGPACGPTRPASRARRGRCGNARRAGRG